MRHEDGKYKVFIMDFGLARFRMNAFDPGTWKLWQADADEEGSIADRVKQMLRAGFEYQPSQTKLEFDAVKGRVWI